MFILYFKAFDEMEEELRMARDQQRKFYSKILVGKNVVAVKRNTMQHTGHDDGKYHAYNKWTCIDM